MLFHPLGQLHHVGSGGDGHGPLPHSLIEIFDRIGPGIGIVGVVLPVNGKGQGQHLYIRFGHQFRRQITGGLRQDHVLAHVGFVPFLSPRHFPGGNVFRYDTTNGPLFPYTILTIADGRKKREGPPSRFSHRSSTGWICSPRRAASTVSGILEKSATRELGFAWALSCPKGTK